MSLPDPDPAATVLITGASSGIGRELALQLAARGHGVTLVARRLERLEELAQTVRDGHGVEADVHSCDLADSDARTALIAALRSGPRRVHGLCNSAGFGSWGRFQDLDAAREGEQVRVNVLALHELCGAFVPEMVRRGGGAILNLGSVVGHQPVPRNATYAATKAFVHSFSEALHQDLAGTGVSCTLIAPGPVRTEWGDVSGGHPLESGPGFLWATPEDIARCAIDGMVKGRRTVTPNAVARTVAIGGRLSPRSVLLPVTGRVLDRLR
jgi:hypothetical protein